MGSSKVGRRTVKKSDFDSLLYLCMAASACLRASWSSQFVSLPASSRRSWAEFTGGKDQWLIGLHQDKTRTGGKSANAIYLLESAELTVDIRCLRSRGFARVHHQGKFSCLENAIIPKKVHAGFAHGRMLNGGPREVCVCVRAWGFSRVDKLQSCIIPQGSILPTIRGP